MLFYTKRGRIYFNPVACSLGLSVMLPKRNWPALAGQLITIYTCVMGLMSHKNV